MIYARMSGFGHSGPYAEYRSYGPVVQAVCGLSHISGLPGREPSGWGLSYMDNQAAYYNASALLMAIYLAKRRTGRGTEIDVSAVEAGVELIGPMLLDVAVNSAAPDAPTSRPATGWSIPSGAARRLSVPGDDRWIAIAVFDDVEWRGLVDVIGSPAWAADRAFRRRRGALRQAGRARRSASAVDDRGSGPPRADDRAAGERACAPAPCRTREDVNETRSADGRIATCSSSWTIR